MSHGASPFGGVGEASVGLVEFVGEDEDIVVVGWLLCIGDGNSAGEHEGDCQTDNVLDHSAVFLNHIAKIGKKSEVVDSFLSEYLFR